MNCAVAGEWQAAYHYAVQAIAVRKSYDAVLIGLDFSRAYETEALLRGGEERQARAEVQRLGECVGTNRRFRLPYLQSLAVLSAWDGHNEHALGHLREAAQLAAATRIIQGLAEGIRDEALRTRFLAGPQIQPVLQQARSETSQVLRDQAKPSGAPRHLVPWADGL